MKKNNEAKAEAMRSHIEACRKSGLTVSDYCIQNGIVKSCYYYWLKQLSPANKPTGFTAISVAQSSCVQVSYPNGVQLCFTGEINVAVLKALVCCI
ncbi:MAG TPA: hypothetical protein VGG71_03570 [Chitinophagaceae bacterium]